MSSAIVIYNTWRFKLFYPTHPPLFPYHGNRILMKNKYWEFLFDYLDDFDICTHNTQVHSLEVGRKRNHCDRRV